MEKPDLWIAGGGPIPTMYGYGYWTGPDDDLLCVVPSVQIKSEAERLLSSLSRYKSFAYIKFLWRYVNVEYLIGGRLKSTSDIYLVALFTRFSYSVLNLIPRRCHKLGYWCEWVYPYGWVPEGGCPYHD